MQSAGQAVIGGIASPDSVAAHIRDIMSLGYNKDIHEDFEKFVIRHIKLIPADKWPQIKVAGGNARTRRVGEILVDWAVLEAARKLTMKDRLMNAYSHEDFLRGLPFTPPKFDMDASPYTPIAWTLRHFGDVHALAESGDYDDIFNQIFRWRTYYKEPFHSHHYEKAKNMSDYHFFRVREKEERVKFAQKKREEERKKQINAQKRERNRAWVSNTVRDLHNKGKRAEIVAELESMPLDDRLVAIANSDYLLDYYHPWCYRGGWGKLFTENNSVFSLDADSRESLALKLEKRNYLGWEEVKRQLSEIA